MRLKHWLQWNAEKKNHNYIKISKEMKLLYNMTWFFGSFRLTPCALVTYHILISKQQRDQDTRVLQVCNWKETTWWEPRGQI